MSTTTQRRRDKERARRLTQRALRGPGAGTLAAIGRALPTPRDRTTVGSYVTRTVCPELLPLIEILAGARAWSTREVVRGLEVLAALHRSPETRARALAEACMEAVQYRELVMVDVRTLEARARYLLGARHAWNADEAKAVEERASDAPERLAREGWGQVELSSAIGILEDVHGIPLTRLLDGRPAR